jgi:DNA-binding MarR family transcriptional regulator
MKDNIKSAWKEFINFSIILREVSERTTHKDDADRLNVVNRLTVAQAKVASYIFEHSNSEIMLKDIAQSVRVTPGAASQMVDFLVKKGLVVRRQKEHDRRAVVISLSDVGKEFINNTHQAFIEITDDIFEGVSEADIGTFVRVFKLAYSRLNEKKLQLDNK